MIGRPDALNGWLMLALAVFTLGLGCAVYYQSELNKVWDAMQTVSPTGAVAMNRAPDADLERIQKLAALRESGAITDAEFETEKAKVMAGTT